LYRSFALAPRKTKHASEGTLGVDGVALPMYVFNLSALCLGRTPTDAAKTETSFQKPIIAYQLLKILHGDDSSYMWHPVTAKNNVVTTQDYANTDYSYCPQIEYASYNLYGNAASTINAKYVHDWSDIRVLFTGANHLPTDYHMSIVNFMEPEVSPCRMSSTDIPGAGGSATANISTTKLFTGTANGSKVYMYDNDQLAPMALTTNYTGGYNTEAIVGRNPDNDAATVFWDSYWSGKIGHPLAYSTSHLMNKKKYWHEKHKITGVIQARNLNTSDAHTQSHIQKIFYRPNKVFDTTDASIIRDTNANIFGISGTTHTDFQPVMGPGYNISLGASDMSLFGSNRKRDDWLLIRSDGLWNSIMSGQEYFSFDATSGVAANNGRFASYTDGVDAEVGAPSFDISIRSKYVVSKG
jgi:hypothetical protein